MSKPFHEEAWELFANHRNSFGLKDDQHLEVACEFEDKFCELYCRHFGHRVGPDQCGKLEHDHCYRCMKVIGDIKASGEAWSEY